VCSFKAACHAAIECFFVKSVFRFLTLETHNQGIFQDLEHGVLTNHWIPPFPFPLPSPPLPLPSLTIPSVHSPFLRNRLPHFPFSPLLFLPSLLFPYPHLEVGPLKSSYGVAGLGSAVSSPSRSAVSSPSGVGMDPQQKSNLVHSALKSDLWWKQF